MLTIQPTPRLKCRRFFLPFLLVFFCCSLSARLQGQAAVYIDPAYTGGSNDGSQAHPFTSWSGISFASNTAYLQKRGTTCNVTSEIAIDEKTGVTFGVYGAGADYAHIITSANTGAVIKLEASLNCTVDGLHVKANNFVQPNGASNYGIYVVDKEGQAATVIPDAGNITIKNCLVEHFVWGIRLMEIGYSNLDNITIDNCIIRDIFQDGMFIQSWQGGDGIGGLHGLLINNCHLSEVNAAFNYYLSIGQSPTETVAGGDGIQLSQYIQDYVIRNTTIDRRGTGLKFCMIHGDEQHTNKYGGTVQNCTFYAADAPGYGGWAHYFAFLSTLNYNNNKVFTSAYAGGIMARSGTILNCSYNTFSGKASTLSAFDLGNTTSRFHNNTIFNYPNYWVFAFSSGYSNIEIYNNIIRTTGSAYSYLTGVTKGYNLFYNAGYWNDSANHSILGQDPLLVNPAIGDFRLQAASPAINQGTVLGYTADMAGTPVPQGGTPDMGALEYISGSTDTQAPSAPDSLKLVYKDPYATSFILSWKPSADNVKVVGYDVYVDGSLYEFSVSGPAARIINLAANQHSVTLKARDAAGNTSAASAALLVPTINGDTIPPAKPTNLTVTSLKRTSCSITFTSEDNEAVTSALVQVYKNDTLVPGLAINSTATSVFISGLAAGTTYSITIQARDAKGNISPASEPLPLTTPALPSCGDADAWVNSAFTGQSGTFTAEFDVVPAGIADAAAGLSDGQVGSFNAMACIVRFYTDGLITARNGNTYSANTALTYSPGTSYHVKMVVNTTAHTYDIYVTPAGQSQVTIGSGYAFRTEQAGVSQLNNYVVAVNLAANPAYCPLILTGFTLNGAVSDTQAPSVPGGLVATAITSGSFKLSWNPSTDSVGVTGYEVFNNGASLGTVTADSMNITGLSPAAATYAMTVRARDAAGNWSAQSTALNVTTTSSATPAAPTALTATGITSTGFTLSWTPSTSSGVAGYDVYRDGTWVLWTTTTSVSITGLTAATTYAMTVKAKSNTTPPVWSLASTTLNVTTAANLPAAPTALTATGITTTGFTLSWTPSTSSGVAGYDVYRDGTWVQWTTTTSVSISGLAAATTYAMTVKAKSNTTPPVWSLASTTLNVTTAANLPAAPTALTATGITTTGFTLSWTPSTSSGVAGYDVYRDGTWVQWTTTTSVSISGLAAATTYAMTVKAKSNTTPPVWSLASTTLNVTTAANIPAAPTALTATGITATGCTLSWTASTSAGVAGYDVYRDGTWVQWTTTTSAGITGLTAASTYAMTVKAKSNTTPPVWSLASTTLNINTPAGRAAPVVMVDAAGTDSPVLIYPNPAHKVFKIITESRSVLRLMDGSGKTVMNRMISKGTTTIQLNVNPGIYLVQVTGEDNRVTIKKLVVN